MSLDVLGFGAVALDEFLYVDEYPQADTKIRVREYQVECGGLTGNALVAAARLGAKCAYAGRLGQSSEALEIERGFAREGVDTSHASRREEDGVVKSTIIVGTASGTRNVFSRRTGLTGARDSEPSEDVVRSARVLLLDHHGGMGGVRAATIAAAVGRAVVGDFERTDAPCLEELLALTNHLIVPDSFARAVTGKASAEAAVRTLATQGREVTVVTSGAQGCWVAEREAEPVHLGAFKVEAIDTACCGDVFHGAYAAALAFRRPLFERLRHAAAAAALKATRRGGQQSFPTADEVASFLKAKGDA